MCNVNEYLENFLQSRTFYVLLLCFSKFRNYNNFSLVTILSTLVHEIEFYKRKILSMLDNVSDNEVIRILDTASKRNHNFGKLHHFFKKPIFFMKNDEYLSKKNE